MQVSAPRTTDAQADPSPGAIAIGGSDRRCGAARPRSADELVSTNLALILVVVVVLAAVAGGRGPGAARCARGRCCRTTSSSLVPYLSLTIESADDVETTIILLVIGLSSASSSPWRAKKHGAAARAMARTRWPGSTGSPSSGPAAPAVDELDRRRWRRSSVGPARPRDVPVRAPAVRSCRCHASSAAVRSVGGGPREARRSRTLPCPKERRRAPRARSRDALSVGSCIDPDGDRGRLGRGAASSPLRSPTSSVRHSPRPKARGARLPSSPGRARNVLARASVSDASSADGAASKGRKASSRDDPWRV